MNEQMRAHKSQREVQSSLGPMTATTVLWSCVSMPSPPSFKVGHVLNPKGKHRRAWLPWRQPDDAVWGGGNGFTKLLQDTWNSSYPKPCALGWGRGWGEEAVKATKLCRTLSCLQQVSAPTLGLVHCGATYHTSGFF